jgi:hypothetical protein
MIWLGGCRLEIRITMRLIIELCELHLQDDRSAPDGVCEDDDIRQIPYPGLMMRSPNFTSWIMKRSAISL